MIHLHITAWVIALILLFVSVSKYKSGNGGKVPHMILRLFYLIIIFSGVMLFMSYANHTMELGLKAVIGIWVIVAMELIAVGTSKGKATKGAWIQFVIAFVLALILGFGRLPMGVQLFG